VRLNLASLLQPHKFDLRESHRKRRRPALVIQITAGCLSWNFKPRVEYELDASGGLFWTRMTANFRVEQFKALAYDAFRDARFKFRRCPECKRPFVPVRRQAYCSSRCSQAVRTRKWRKAHPEKNREIRRQQYKRSVAAKLRLSKRAEVKVAKHAQDRRSK
jgi:hypothetical protein